MRQKGEGGAASLSWAVRLPGHLNQNNKQPCSSACPALQRDWITLHSHTQSPNLIKSTHLQWDYETVNQVNTTVRKKWNILKQSQPSSALSKEDSISQGLEWYPKDTAHDISPCKWLPQYKTCSGAIWLWRELVLTKVRGMVRGFYGRFRTREEPWFRGIQDGPGSGPGNSSLIIIGSWCWKRLLL